MSPLRSCAHIRRYREPIDVLKEMLENSTFADDEEANMQFEYKELTRKGGCIAFGCWVAKSCLL